MIRVPTHFNIQINSKVHSEFEIEVSHCVSNFVLSFWYASIKKLGSMLHVVISENEKWLKIGAMLQGQWSIYSFPKFCFLLPENAENFLHSESTRNGSRIHTNLALLHIWNLNSMVRTRCNIWTRTIDTWCPTGRYGVLTSSSKMLVPFPTWSKFYWVW